MKTALKKQVAVWLDYSEAHIIGYDDMVATFIENIDSPYEKIKRERGKGAESSGFSTIPNFYSNNENKKHHIAQNEQNEYFKMLEHKLMDYDEILLFGPTKAKDELHNRLSENKKFLDKTVSVKSSDKMTDHQMLAFTRDFYKN